MDTELTPNKINELYPGENFQELIDAGVFYGRKRTKTHPRMRPYILTTRNDMEIINLSKTLEGLEQAIKFLGEKIKNGAVVLLVGTQPPAVEDVLKLASEFNLPSVTTRWLGGFLTNFKVIAKRIDHFKKLKAESQSGGLEKYTKKERLKIEEEIKRLEELFSGVENMGSLPDVIILIDPSVHLTAVREARRLKIPLIALVNTDSDPEVADYPVVANTKARKSINWFLGKLAEAIREARVVSLQQPVEVAEPPSSTAGEATAKVQDK